MPEVTAKQKEVQKKLEVERWKMPVPRSQLVRWQHGDGNGDTMPALVTSVGRDTIDVMVFSRSGNFRTYDGCRHKTDPSLKGRTEPNPGGVFELTEFELTMNRLAHEMM